MENVDSSEKKELIPTSDETIGDDKIDNPSNAQGESVSETQSLSSNDLHNKDKNVSTELGSLNSGPEGDTELVPSGIQSSHENDLEGEKPGKMQSSETADIQIEDQGDLSKEVAPQNGHQEELTSKMQSPKTADLQIEDQGELSKEVVSREHQGEAPSGMQSPNPADLQIEDQGDRSKEVLSREHQGEAPSGMQSPNTADLQIEDQGDLSKEVAPQNEHQEELTSKMQSPNTTDLLIEDPGEFSKEVISQNEHQGEAPRGMQSLDNNNHSEEVQDKLPCEVSSLNTKNEAYEEVGKKNEQISNVKNMEKGSPHEKSQSLEELSLRSWAGSVKSSEQENPEEKCRSLEEIINEEREIEPVFDGTESPGSEATGSSSEPGNAWPDKAVALKNFVREKSVVAVSSVIRRLAGKKDDDDQNLESEGKDVTSTPKSKDEQNLNPDTPKETSPKPVERSAWNPLNYIKIGRDLDIENNDIESVVEPPPLKGRIMVYTRLGCLESREVRLFLLQRRLRYVEINIDVYPSRKLELEKYSGSSSVPKVFFNELVIGGLSELNEMDESGKLKDMIHDLITQEPSAKAPVPPLSGEDDESCSGMVDELALVVRKMRDSILVKDRFQRMRRFSNCFVGSEAVDFLSEDQYLERKEAIEFGRKLASKHFFRHVLEENIFEDGNHLYRFLDDDPIVSTQCYNMTRGIIESKPKPIIDIASRLRFLSLAMFEAYTSVDGKHVDYRSIHGSEEFARYLRVVEELQRVEVQDISREEKLAFFLNLYNMMAIHGILMWGYPVGALERRKMFGDFKYVIGGYTYSLSAIENGILRCNQRPPYNIMKPFGAQDPRAKIALPYPEPLIHFALVNGTRSAPALRCYSPCDIDKELMEAARDFLRNGAVVMDLETKVASVSKIFRWYSADFGKNEMEVMKHVANYLETDKSGVLLELLATMQLRVAYQNYDWGVNC